MHKYDRALRRRSGALLGPCAWWRLAGRFWAVVLKQNLEVDRPFRVVARGGPLGHRLLPRFRMPLGLWRGMALRRAVLDQRLVCGLDLDERWPSGGPFGTKVY